MELELRGLCVGATNPLSGRKRRDYTNLVIGYNASLMEKELDEITGGQEDKMNIIKLIAFKTTPVSCLRSLEHDTTSLLVSETHVAFPMTE